jgi:hypothetical protein
MASAVACPQSRKIELGVQTLNFIRSLVDNTLVAVTSYITFFVGFAFLGKNLNRFLYRWLLWARGAR